MFHFSTSNYYLHAVVKLLQVLSLYSLWHHLSLWRRGPRVLANYDIDIDVTEKRKCGQDFGTVGGQGQRKVEVPACS